MKTAEKWFEQDGKLIQKKTYDHNPLLKRVEDLKSAGADGFSENKLVGVVSLGMMATWAGEAGIKGSDPSYWMKMQEVVNQKLQSGDFNKLRVWEGSY